MEELRARAESLGAGGPLFSILLPIYQTPERWLRRCIASVLAQVYPNWQLCIVDAASPDMRAMDVVEEYARGDERIEFMRRDVNGPISEASNRALPMALRACVALTDHASQRRHPALLEPAEAIPCHPRSC